MRDKVPFTGNHNCYATQLLAWGKQMEKAGIDTDRLQVTHVTGLDDLTMGIVSAEIEEADVILIDTPSRPTDLTVAAVERSTLTVTPATNGMEAALIVDSITKQYTGFPPKICGLVTGTSGPDEDVLVKKAFLEWRTFETTLPHSSYLQAQLQGELLFNGKVRRGDAGGAQRAGQAFSRELMQVAGNKPPLSIFMSLTNMPVGSAVDHWRELAKQNPHLWQ